jgi:hypothetical protein
LLILEDLHLNLILEKAGQLLELSVFQMLWILWFIGRIGILFNMPSGESMPME